MYGMYSPFLFLLESDPWDYFIYLVKFFSHPTLGLWVVLKTRKKEIKTDTSIKSDRNPRLK